MPVTAEELLARFGTARTLRGTWEDHWQECADHIYGRRDFNRITTPGRKRLQRIYDNTGLLSLDLLASAMHSFLTNTATRFVELRTEIPELMEDPDVLLWLEMSTDRLLNAMSRPQSYFTPQIHEVYFDWIGFGTGALYIDDRNGWPVFSARPLGETFVLENGDGVVDTVFRRFHETHRNAVAFFGAEASRAAARVERHPEDKQQYLHVIWPNDEVIYGNLDFTGMPWASVYLDIDDKKIIRRGGFQEMPYMTPRWSKDAGELYGRGPGINALPDAKMLNQMSRTTLKGAMKAVDPPAFIPDDGVTSNLRFAPGTINTVDRALFESTRGSPIFQPPGRVGEIGLGVNMEERRARNVQRAFHSDLLELFRDPNMTATQVRQLAEQATRLLSPVLGRGQTELLEPMVERVFGILLRNGKLPPPPPILAGQNLKIDYVSPISRAQRAGDVQGITELLAISNEMAQAAPEILDNVDGDFALREIARQRGVPQRVLRDPRLVARRRAARAQLEAQREQFEQVNQAAQTVSRLAPGLARAERELQQ